MSSRTRGRASRSVVATTAAAALAASALSVVAVVATAGPAHAATVDITLLDINDYHGRIQSDVSGTNDAGTDTPMELATTIEGIRAAQGADDVAFVSAGDNIGASLFNSSFADDEPTIEVLNAIGLQASAVGNHEFDKGWPWYRRHVVRGNEESYTQADFPSLGANVYRKGTKTPVLDEYALVEVGGLDMCVIGAITQETPSLVSPDGISMLDFGNPVGAVNRVARELEGTDTCDLTVATYHEGAGAGTPDGADIEEEVAAGGAFADIVTRTDAAVDAIFTGHTHKEYAWTYAKPGGEGTRPIVQTGSYGANVGRVDLSVDTASGDVSLVNQENVVVGTEEDLSNPVVAEVAQITADAVADANVVGDVAEGEVTDDITTAFSGGTYGADGYTGGTRDNRGAESTLGNLVAEALLTPITDVPDLPTPDIGVVNPGGLRAELLFAADRSTSDQNGDGVVTYEEAVAVLPFANDVNYVTLTGAEFEQVLEQQWQTTSEGGPRPSNRPFLHLGLSENVSVTMAPDTSATSPVGDNIHTVMVDGEPLDPDREYVVSTFSFLAQGGDNFRAFRQGEVTATGKIDRDLWIEDFLSEAGAQSPSFDRRQVFADQVPVSMGPGEDTTISLSKLNLTSLGSPANTEVVASYVDGDQRTELTTAPVDATGAATVGFTVPADAQGGRVEIVAAPSGTTVTIPVTDESAPDVLTADVAPNRVVVDRTSPVVRIAAEVGGEPFTGTVDVRVGKRVVEAMITDGTGSVRLEPFARTGPKEVRVVLRRPDDDLVTTTTFRVVRR